MTPVLEIPFHFGRVFSPPFLLQLPFTPARPFPAPHLGSPRQYCPNQAFRLACYGKPIVMMTQYEIARFIAGKLPEIKNDLHYCQAGNVYQPIQVLTEYTKRMALEHNFKMVGKCMILADAIYQRGNIMVKNAVENVFIFAFSSVMALYNIVEWRIVQSYMPRQAI
jgi:hypothetical protein